MNISNSKQIFNWVHKKFHHNILKVPNLKKTIDMLGNWKHDILLTQAFMFDSLKSLDQQDQCPITYDEFEDKDDDFMENEMYPLMYITFGKYFKEYIDENGTKLAFIKMNKNGDRITLADLLLNDFGTKIELDNEKMALDSNENSIGLIKKKEITLAKKVIPHVGQDSMHVKKLPKLMKKIWKKKIHPNDEIKFQKMDGQLKSVDVDLLTWKESQCVDSFSLIPSQDSIA